MLFLVGLLLLGGSVIAAPEDRDGVHGGAQHHAVAGGAECGRHPPARLIEPAIALSIVYVGADNLLVRPGSRDMRVWIAFTFGFIHGFGFASVLREMDLPRRALGWSLFSFNLGVEIGQVCIVLLVASALAWIAARSTTLQDAHRLRRVGRGRRGGVVWFVQRVFFIGGGA